MTKSHDRRGYYGKSDLPKHAKFAAITITDPYGQPAFVNGDGTTDHAARLDQFPHQDGTVAHGAPGWTPPSRPTITVIRSLRNDPLGRMHARHQIDQAEFLAGRAYQECFAAAQLASGQGMAMMGASGGISEPLTENRQRALRKLRMIDMALVRRHGSEGVMLVRDVLGEGHSIEAAAHRRASSNERGIRSWGWLFRRCLGVIAFRLGYASTPMRRKS